jgi:His/Glu/Gln/Arg/opine family amino acid ABC transporter permease subunit
MTFDWSVVTNNYSVLLMGLRTTLAITFVTLGTGAILGLLLCAARISPIRSLSTASKLYIAFFRITPELVLIFWAYFCLPPIFGLMLTDWFAGTLALIFVAGAYLAEIYRAGIEAVPRGQVEGAKALGLGTFAIWVTILLPQAIRQMAPAFLNYFTEALKNSTLLAGVGVAELSYQAYTLGAMSYRYLELFTAVAALFFLVITPISVMTRVWEDRLARSRT